MKDTPYKNLEEKHYDAYFAEGKDYDYSGSDEIIIKDKINLGAIKFIEKVTSGFMKEIGKGKILDYGCSIGERTHKFSSNNWEITGIDISAKSIEIANSLKNRYNLNANYFVMDCEKMDFPENEFDIVYDFGTFSSLDIDKAITQIIRVLKPGGCLIAIETLGNNPIFILKRKINFLLGYRTKWAIDHIMKIKDWEKIEKYFQKSEIRYYSFLTPYLTPFLFFIPSRSHRKIISYVESIDDKLLRREMFKKFAFKSVAIMQNPRK